MTARAISRYVRVSPRKTRYVLDIIRGRVVEDAFAVLANANKGAAFYIRQVLKTALDSAVKKTNNTADASNLFISKATADGGPSLKRWKAGSMGRGMPILRRTAHILIELDMIEKPKTTTKVSRKRDSVNGKKRKKHGA